MTKFKVFNVILHFKDGGFDTCNAISTTDTAARKLAIDDQTKRFPASTRDNPVIFCEIKLVCETIGPGPL